jgi:sulfur-oxidizing protein SoxY
MERRHFLMASAMVCVAGTLGALVPRRVLATWPEAAFTSGDPKEALSKLLGDVSVEAGGVDLQTPSGQVDGAAVRITISTDLPKVSSIVIVSEPNPAPLIARFNLEPGTRPYLMTNIKVAESGKIMVLVKADGKFYKVEKAVKVTAGACA